MEIDVLKILELNSLLNNLIEGFDDFLYSKKINITIKDKILLNLMEKSCSPYELIKKISIAKSNLTLVANELIKENKIIKEKDSIDKRSIIYTITDEGKLKAQEILKKIKRGVNSQIEYKNNNEEINKMVAKLLTLLN